MLRQSKTLLALAGLATALMLSACGKNSSPGANASIRLLNVSSDSGPLNVRINAETTDTISNVTYEAISGYRSISTTTPTLNINTAANTTQATQSANLAQDGRHTIIVTGRASATNVLVLSDATTNPTSGNFRVRFANAATGNTSLDVYFLAAGASLATAVPNISNIAVNVGSVYVEVAKGDYTVYITPNGSKEVLFQTGPRTFADQANVTLIAYATGSSRLVNAAFLLPTDDATAASFPANPFARIKTVQATPDVALMDLLVDSQPQFSNLPYGQSTGYVTVASGARNIRVQATNVPGSFLADKTQTLQGGRDYTIVNIGSQGVVNPVALVDTNFAPAAGRARVRFVNANLVSTPIDVFVNFAAQSQASNIAANSASPYLELDANTYAFTVTRTGSTANIINLTGIVIEAGQRYSLYVTGTAAAPGSILSRDP